MRYDAEKHHRRSIRLQGWDYRNPGAYFVTIVAHGRELLFGEVVDDEIRLSEFGEIARDEWLASPDIRREIQLDAFVVMPNHIHGIVWIVAADNVGARGRVGATGRSPLPPHGPVPQSLGSFIAGCKSAVTKRINQIRDTSGAPVWQRNYYEHIIRNKRELETIRRCIQENPVRWAEDRENPMRNQCGTRRVDSWDRKQQINHPLPSRPTSPCWIDSSPSSKRGWGND